MVTDELTVHLFVGLACALKLDEAIHGAIVMEVGHPVRASKQA
jgi:hypothetical protein